MLISIKVECDPLFASIMTLQTLFYRLLITVVGGEASLSLGHLGSVDRGQAGASRRDRLAWAESSLHTV